MVAFADISTKMVLRVSAEPKPRQEEIEVICDLAAKCLDSPKLPAFFEGEAPYSALVVDDAETKFFVRSLTDPADALILIVTEPAEQSQIWTLAQDLLNGQATQGVAQ